MLNEPHLLTRLRQGQYMKTTGCLFVLLFIFSVIPASLQETVAPDISGISIQGSDISLGAFKDQKNVLVVFYRMHA